MEVHNLQVLFFKFFQSLVNISKKLKREVSMKNIIMAVALCLSLVACNPFKVTDPNDPRFDPMKFKFSDYTFNNNLYDALDKSLTNGISIEEIDKILVDSGKAEKKFVKTLVNKQNLYTYKYRRWYHPIFSFLAMHPDPGKGVTVGIYTKDNKLEKFHLK